MAEADPGSGLVSIFPVNDKLQARMYVLKDAIESQKLEVRKIGGEMKSLIEEKENEIIKELDYIWDDTNTRVDREKEEVQKKIKEIRKRYQEMNQLFEQMDRKLPPLPQISEAVDSVKSELDISIPQINLSWRDNVLKEGINRMCRVEQVYKEEGTHFSSQLGMFLRLIKSHFVCKIPL